MGKQLWRYDPKDNRTPKTHPILGHLEWGQLYDNPLCANDPDFVEVKDGDEKKPAEAAKPADDKPAAEKAPEAGKPAGA